MNNSPTSDRTSSYFYHALRLCLGFVYFHFGFLKFLPGVSPAEVLAGQTITALTFEVLSPSASVFLLAICECGLGVLLITNRFPRTAYFAFMGHMIGTFSPFILLPQVTFNDSLLTPTLEGQYILKNVVFMVAVSAVYIPHLFPTSDWLGEISKMAPQLNRLGDLNRFKKDTSIETPNLLAEKN